MTSGRVKAIGAGFTLDGCPFEILGATMFSLFYDWAFGNLRDFVDTMLVAMRQSAVKNPRIFVTVADTAWEDGTVTGYPVVLDPSVQPTFYQKLFLFARMMEEAGFFPIYVVFGSCQNGFETQADRTLVCQNVAATLQSIPCLMEICWDPVGADLGREGGSVGVDPYDEAQRLVTVYKTGDINNPVAAGGATESVDINRPLSDWMSYTPDRSIANDKWGWIVEQVTNSCVIRNGNPRAVVAALPMCAGGNAASDNNDENTVHWWAWGLLCQFMQIGACFHAEQLLGSEFTLSDNFYQFQAWREGRQTVARNDFAQFYLASGTPSGDAPWTNNAALMVYGRHNGLIGMAVAMDVPSGWDPTTDLAAGWTAEIIEQRDDAVLVGLMQV